MLYPARRGRSYSPHRAMDQAGRTISVCAVCGHHAPLGDWQGRWTYYVGELAVRFNNWPPLTEGFIADLGAHLGPRWRVVYEHA
jgi:hypothetical protein